LRRPARFGQHARIEASPVTEGDMNKTEVAELLGVPDDSLAMAPIEDILETIATAPSLPDLAIAICALRMEEAAPAFHALLARAADGEALPEDHAQLLFYGVYLLGGARDQGACQPLLRLLHRPEKEIDGLLGDAVTVSLSRIFVGVFDGDADALFATIADPAIDEFIRKALFGAAAFLTWEGRIGRDRMRGFLERFVQEPLATDEDFAWIGWVEAIAALGLRDMAPLVHAAWDAGRIPDGIIERSHFEQDLADAERAPEDGDRFERANVGRIEDVLDALSWTRRTTRPDQHEDDDEEQLATQNWQPSYEPVKNPLRHVGRNDPCPCGSGRKFKKCCLPA
jgi:hypothetical protein